MIDNSPIKISYKYVEIPSTSRKRSSSGSDKRNIKVTEKKNYRKSIDSIRYVESYNTTETK